MSKKKKKDYKLVRENKSGIIKGLENIKKFFVEDKDFLVTMIIVGVVVGGVLTWVVTDTIKTKQHKIDNNYTYFATLGDNKKLIVQLTSNYGYCTDLLSDNKEFVYHVSEYKHAPANEIDKLSDIDNWFTPEQVEEIKELSDASNKKELSLDELKKIKEDLEHVMNLKNGIDDSNSTVDATTPEKVYTK